MIADEVFVVANQSIDLQAAQGASAGALIETRSAASGSAPAPGAFATPSTLTLAGANASGAALLSASDLATYTVARPTAAPAAPAPAMIAIDAGAQVRSLGAVGLDAPGGATMTDGAKNGTGLAGAGARFTLGSADIVFGAGAPTPGTLQIDPALLAALRPGQCAHPRRARTRSRLRRAIRGCLDSALRRCRASR